MIYAFAGLGHDYKIRALDPYNDLKENYGKGAFLKFTALKNINKNLKTLIAIGGWNEGSIKYSNMVAKPETRKIFVDSVVAFIDKYGIHSFLYLIRIQYFKCYDYFSNEFVLSMQYLC